MPFAKGQPVRIEMLTERPTMSTTRLTVHVRYGIYLGIPRFETTIANVRVGDRIRRFPLEYLHAVE